MSLVEMLEELRAEDALVKAYSDKLYNCFMYNDYVVMNDATEAHINARFIPNGYIRTCCNELSSKVGKMVGFIQNKITGDQTVIVILK